MALLAERPLIHAVAFARRATWHPSRLTIVLALQLATMTALAAILGTWTDEEYTLTTTAHGVGYAIGRALGYEQQAPLYFVLIALLREIAPAPFWARMFSVVCALGITASAAAITRRLAPSVASWAPAALVAFNPFVVFAALEIRLYALAILVSALLWLTFYDGFFWGESRRAQGAFAALAVAALYLEYFLALELLGCAVALLVAGRWRALSAYVVAAAISLGAFVPLLLVLQRQVTAAFSVPFSKPLPPRAVFLHPLLDFVIPNSYGGAAATAWLLDAALIVAVAVAIAIGRPRFGRRTVALGALAASVEAIYAILVDVLHMQLVVPRHFVALFVPELAFAYAVVAGFAGVHAATARRTIGLCIALATALSLVYTYRSLAKSGDWPRVGAWLETHARAADTIAIYQADSVPPFERYYHGRARVVGFPHPLHPKVYSVSRMIVHSKAEALRAFAALPQNGRLWFVAYDTCDWRDAYGCQEVAAVIRAHYRVVERRQFYLTTVERLVLSCKGRRKKTGGQRHPGFLRGPLQLSTSA
ncbi:MAG: hypothetical protein M3R44_05480 [Candidatus Eremiobacteraeota bacterium]|nr:hypothetical protein [Candidatus Eremiobacteraeota bacterium]